ncbi:predicted protein [Sclerotinia sclerotiorum 1980 UF-70]|nr:predicted protein [Sclerotinia sclerotiorum 1980 UF-70]EDN97429.1 predicted protein [Sclerotinia sclerotiorum 1980 UF-70]
MKDEINDSRPRKVLKKSHSGDSAESVGSIGTASQGSAGGGGGGGKGSIGYGNIGVGGISNGGVMGSGTAVPASLGGRTTMESQPVHARSLGFNEGGVTGITNIEEGREGSGRSSTSSTNSMVKGALRNEENSVERGEREIMNEQIERYGDDLSF